MQPPAMTAVPRRTLKTDLRACTVDGSFFSLMVGCGESYIPAFVLAVGLGEVVAGLSATVPLLAGALVQLFTPAGVRRSRSHRRWCVAWAGVQGLAFVPLALAALHGRISAAGVLLLATWYWGAGMLGGPAWNVWMTRLVPRAVRTPYFARRTRIMQVATLLALVGAGTVLEAAQARGLENWGFALIFAAAGAFRFVSTAYLARQREMPGPPLVQRDLQAGELLSWTRSAGGRLIVYMFGVQLVTQVAAPYFTPYVLKQLHFGYGAYVVLLATMYLAKVAGLPVCGAIAQRRGARWLLGLAGLAIVPVPLLWAASASLAWLVVAQVVAGLGLAAYELATLLLMFETIPEQERTSALTVYNLTNAVANVAGSVLAALLLAGWGEQVATYMVIFALSAAGRVATLPLLRGITEVPRVPAEVAAGTLAARPGAAGVDNPYLPGIPTPEELRDKC